MNNNTRQLIEDFFLALGKGDDLTPYITEDMGAWIVSSGETPKAQFLPGVKFLAQIFNGTLRYQINALTVEENRAAAEVTSAGTLMNGDDFRNDHVFLFRLSDGKVSWMGEFMNQLVVNEKIVPLMQEAMAKAGG